MDPRLAAVWRRVFTTSSGWKSRVEQVPLMEPARKAFTTGLAEVITSILG